MFAAIFRYLSFLFTVLVGFRLVRQRFRQRFLRNVRGPQRTSLLKGNLPELFNPYGWDFHFSVLRTYGGVARIHGLAGDTQLYVSDAKALHNIVVKDQHIFERPSAFLAGTDLFFGMGLLSTGGDHHRRQRKMLNPVFSINHMRYMIPIFRDISSRARDLLMAKVKQGPKEIDAVKWMTVVALELVGQGGLGYSFEALNENVKNEYGEAVKNFMPAVFSLVIYRQFLPWLLRLAPRNLLGFVARRLPWKQLRAVIDITDIMDRTSRAILTSKKAALSKGDNALMHQIGEGRDIMSILLKANMAAAEDNRLPESEVLAQMSTLIFAAMDTTSSALSRILQLLAEHQGVQDKLRDELVKAQQAGDEFDYDDMHSLPYLDAVCRETLRLFPPVVLLSRTARQDVVLPLGTPVIGVDGTKISEILVPDNTDVVISIIGVNRDPAIWGPDAAEWKPERWLSPLPDSVAEARIPGVYANTLTFLGGGRSCIGFKFSQLEMKVVLANLLPTLRFSMSDKNILWRLGSLSTPTVEGSRGETTMPLVISVVNK